jgi:hypothetical protein
MIRMHLQIVGTLLLLLGAAHSVIPRYFGWKRELAAVSLFTRQVFMVHHFFIGLLVAMLGLLSLFHADDLLQPMPLSRAVLIGILAFWLIRFVFQLAVYDPAIWRGKPFYTAMHVVFSFFWGYVVVTYAVALRSVLN